MTYLPPLNENLERLDCHGNHLTFLPSLNDKLQVFIYNDNPIHEILCETSNKIISQYHPTNLENLNNEDTDLADFLDNWL